MKEPRFSAQTLKFMDKASRQKHPEWLDRNRADYEKHLLLPLQRLARELKRKLGPHAPDYNFPQKGLGRLKRSALRAEEYGALYRDYVSYSAARPRVSRFDHNPNVYLLLQPHETPKDRVLIAGGLYMPSSRQLRAIREAIARDASAFDELFRSKAFASRFPGGFSDERKATRPPRGFDPNHERIDWLKLQAFFVWRSYTAAEFASASFPDLVAKDGEQIIRLNKLLDLAIQNRLPSSQKPTKKRPSALASRLEGVEAPRREMDF